MWELYTTTRSPLCTLEFGEYRQGDKKHSGTFSASCRISNEHFRAKIFRVWFPRKTTAVKHATANQVQCPCSLLREYQCTDFYSVLFLLHFNRKECLLKLHLVVQTVAECSVLFHNMLLCWRRLFNEKIETELFKWQVLPKLMSHS